ncbi:uncharacterized protein LOC114461081 [Gouania willdenowi]|uniref:uncharacterized protein LOC114461081 n=1 Tax=Gouania willdenowi TaxID=441366 RepID=UPI001054823E|nr:uncharacterized protein LOC114461081 [Gouania willdenowi]
MELFQEGTYRPIGVLFDTPVYRQIFQNCWHMPSYKVHVAMVAELLRLQKENQLLSEVTPEDMARHLHVMSKRSLRVQLLDFQLQEYDNDDDDEVRMLLSMAREVNDSMRMRDIQLDAQRLISAPELMPPNFISAKMMKEAKAIGEALTERHQQTSCSEHLQQPRDVVLDVVPKVLQGLWVPKPRLFLTMPSMKLDKMAVGVTKGVEDGVLAALGSTTHEVNMSRSTRDEMITSIIKTLHEAYPKDIRRKMLNSFSPQLMHHVAEVTAEQITALFQPRGKQEDTMSLPEEPTTLPEEPKSLTEEPTSLPDETTSLNEEPTSLHEEVKSLPEDPTSLPEEPKSLTEEPTSLPDETTSLNEEPTSLHEEPKSLTEEPTSLHEEPKSLTEEPTSLHEEPKSLTEEPTSLPDETTSLNEEPTSLHVEPKSLTEEPTFLHEQSPVKVEESRKKKKSRMNRFIRWMQKRIFTRIHPQ